MFKAIIGLTAVLVLGACATQGQSHDSQELAEASDQVCVNDRVTGSRQPRRICHTEEQWTQMRADAKESVRLIQRYPEGADPDPN